MSEYKKKIIKKIEAFHYDEDVGRGPLIDGLLKLDRSIVVKIAKTDSKVKVFLNNILLVINRYVFINELGAVVQLNETDFESEYTLVK